MKVNITYKRRKGWGQEHPWICQVSNPGTGPLSAAVFLGELGNPTCFQNARQIVKYAVYDPRESDSGYIVSRKFISKRGRCY